MCRNSKRAGWKIRRGGTGPLTEEEGEAARALRSAAGAVGAGTLLADAALAHLAGERRGDVLVAVVPGAVERRGDGELLAALARALAERVQGYEARAQAAGGGDAEQSSSPSSSDDGAVPSRSSSDE